MRCGIKTAPHIFSPSLQGLFIVGALTFFTSTSQLSAASGIIESSQFPVTVALTGDLVCPPYNQSCKHADTSRLLAEVKKTSVLDVFIPLGDLQYNAGSYGDFTDDQAGYQRYFGDFVDITYPVTGNHEYLECVKNAGWNHTCNLPRRDGEASPYAFFDVPEGGCGLGADGKAFPAADSANYRKGCAPGFTRYFHKTLTDVNADVNGLYYAVDITGPDADVPAWHFVFLNTNCDQTIHNYVPPGADASQRGSVSTAVGSCLPDGKQYAWLKADLENNQANCTVIVSHHPRYNSGAEHRGAEAIDGYWDLAVDHGVDMIISAHEHFYERFHPKDKNGRVVDRERGLIQFISGHGGNIGEIAVVDDPSSAFIAGIPMKQGQGGSNPPPELPLSVQHAGALFLTLHEDSYSYEMKVLKDGKTAVIDNGTTERNFQDLQNIRDGKAGERLLAAGQTFRCRNAP